MGVVNEQQLRIKRQAESKWQLQHGRFGDRLHGQYNTLSITESGVLLLLDLLRLSLIEDSENTSLLTSAEF